MNLDTRTTTLKGPMNNPSRHLYDIITSKVIDPWKEFYRLKRLFLEDTFIGHHQVCSFKEYIKSDFRMMPIRGTAPDIDSFLLETLPRCDWNNCKLDDLIIYCEVLENILLCIPPQSFQSMPTEGRTICTQILENIAIIFENAGYKFIKHGGFEYAVRKDSAVDEAIEHIRDDQVALDVLEYNRVSLKGNLKRKREILASFGLYAEQFFKDPKFADQFKRLRTDVGFCLNSLSIRHNATANKESQKVLNGMSDSELEEWYDRTYTLLISVVLANKVRDIYTQIDSLKKEKGLSHG